MDSWHRWMEKYGPKEPFFAQKVGDINENNASLSGTSHKITLNHNGQKLAFYDRGMINDPGAFLCAIVKNNVLVIFGAGLWHDPYDLQYDKIANADKRHHFARIGVETNGGGYESLQALQKKLGSKVEGFNTVNQLSTGTDRSDRLVKTEEIVKLQRLFTNNQIAFAHTKALESNKVLEELKKQINNYEITKTPSGQVKLSAPSGLHDDLTICCLGLAKMVSEGVFQHGMVAIRWDGTSTMDDNDRNLGPYAQLKKELDIE